MEMLRARTSAVWMWVRRSRMSGVTPCSDSSMASAEPTGPPPTTTTSARDGRSGGDAGSRTTAGAVGSARSVPASGAQAGTAESGGYAVAEPECDPDTHDLHRIENS